MKKTGRKLVHASTFSGIGAPEIAAEMLGWSNAFHCEINGFGRELLGFYFPQSESYDDITTTDFSKWRGKIDVLTGGFPCQPFSIAGQRRGADDDRYLWPFMLKCICQVRPTWFVGENVSGISTMVLPGKDVEVGSGGSIFDETHYIRRDDRFVVEEICQQLEESGYSVQPMLIPACAVGAPHRRDRIFFIAHRNDCDNGEGRTDERASSDAYVQRPDKRDASGKPGEEKQLHSEDDRERGNTDRRGNPVFKGLKTKLSPENRWRNFPTQPPVYRGNDGLPFSLDDLSISFNRWKKESLKAYGNAIVVQVMYEIFRAIQTIEENEEQKYVNIQK